MILVSQVVLPVEFDDQTVRRELSRRRIPPEAEWSFRKLSLDARKKYDLHYLASLETMWPEEKKFLKKNRDRNISAGQPVIYQMPSCGDRALNERPIIVGAGPAGLFCARTLAEAGFAPILLERGAPVEERTRDVEAFWNGAALNESSNVQFGEGGAGTFSDGKLNSGVKERSGRIHQVLRWFVEAGADPRILYWNKPHIGTDVLKIVVRNLRKQILSLGGEVRFHTQALSLLLSPQGSVEGIRVLGPKGEEVLETGHVVLAIGHSARDTFSELKRLQIPMEQKAFAMGVRIEHPQALINESQYGIADLAGRNLPTADYKLTAQTSEGRGVYSFCMCPGGQVVNASSEAGRIAVNGMSLAARNGRNANSALVVSVRTSDFASDDVLAGVEMQRRLEHLAWQTGGGHVPAQTLKDFRENRESRTLGDVLPDIRGAYALTNLREALPDFISNSILEVMPVFSSRIQGYDRPDAVLSGVESRTSSPVRILRDEHFESAVKGLFPCGEGAGYAGGITSAAVDGIKVAEELIRRYHPVYE